MNEREFSTRVRACTDKLWRVSWAILQKGEDRWLDPIECAVIPN